MLPLLAWVRRILTVNEISTLVLVYSTSSNASRTWSSSSVIPMRICGTIITRIGKRNGSWGADWALSEGGEKRRNLSSNFLVFNRKNSGINALLDVEPVAAKGGAQLDVTLTKGSIHLNQWKVFFSDTARNSFVNYQNLRTEQGSDG
jgi:hypothetical protein